MPKPLRQLLPWLLALGLAYYALRNVPLSQLLAEIRRAQAGWVTLAGGLVVGHTLLRAWRWQLLLRSLRRPVSLSNALTALLAGNAASMLIPGAGELTRCSALRRTDGVPLAESIGSVVAERLADLLALAFVAGLVLPFGAAKVLGDLQTSLSLWRERLPLFLGLAIVLVLLAAAAFWLLGLGSGRWQGQIQALGAGFTSIGRVRPLGPYLLLNLAIHACSILSLYALFCALPTTAGLGLGEAALVFVLTTVGGMLIPTQAGVGSYHLLASRVLWLCGISLTDATIWATFAHAVINLTSLLISLLGLLLAVRIVGPTQPAPTES